MATDIALAWAAGLFEGEGSLRYYRDQLGLKLTNSELELVSRFYLVVQLGTIRHTKSGFEWACHKQKDCREIMILLWPHLCSRTKQRWNEILKKREQAFSERACPVCAVVYRPIRRQQVCCSQPCAAKHTKAVGKYTNRKTKKEVVENGR